MIVRIYSYNVNGLRAAINKGFINWLKNDEPDILCIQETKLQPEQIDSSVFNDLGYNDYWFSAQKKGYSGVAVLTKEKPENIIYGMGIKKYDEEGRVIQMDYKEFTLICVYIPSGTMGGPRQDFKMEFLDDFLIYLNDLKKEKQNLVISGDYNICHKPIDINHPERHQKSSGFLPEERAWFDKFIDSEYVDTFREFNSEPQQYSWWSYRANAREKNLGWRIDYNIITSQLKMNLKSAGILSSVKHSDHCPVFVGMEF